MYVEIACWKLQTHLPGGGGGGGGQWVNPSGAAMLIFQHNLVSTVAPDALAPGVTKSPATLVLTLQNKLVLVFHDEVFQLPSISQC